MFNFDFSDKAFFDEDEDMMISTSDTNEPKQYEKELAEMRANGASEEELWCFEMFHLIREMADTTRCLFE